MKTQSTDLFNKVANEIRVKYFPEENHGTTENKNYWKATKIIEYFNNGILSYKVFVDKLSVVCKTDKDTIHNLLKKIP